MQGIEEQAERDRKGTMKARAKSGTGMLVQYNSYTYLNDRLIHN